MFLYVYIYMSLDRDGMYNKYWRYPETIGRMTHMIQLGGKMDASKLRRDHFFPHALILYNAKSTISSADFRVTY